MKTTYELRALLDRIDLGIDNAYFEIKVGRLGKATEFDQALPVEEVLFVRIQRVGLDNHCRSCPLQTWPGRWWVVQDTDTENQIVNTLLKAVLTYVEHEHRERFTLDGETIYEPNH